ncbi:tetratricopeptide repeat protein [Micromonospora saelicesensis]|uniref:tetratricopeptide repeat protein n=1 Tax=Micromonospora saelicesensis TaxID=285676 RepID=UPI001C658DBB
MQLRRRVLGEEHRHTLTSMNNLAGMLSRMGELTEARRLHEQELEAAVGAGRGTPRHAHLDGQPRADYGPDG